MLDDTKIHLSLRNKLHLLPSVYVTTFFDNANGRDATVFMLLFTPSYERYSKNKLTRLSTLGSCKSILKGSNLSHFLCCTEDAAV